MSDSPFPKQQKWSSVGGIAPLFDRLTDMDPEVIEEVVPFLTYSKDQVIESIAREASNILNTRCTVPYQEYEDTAPSSLAYGIPDLYGFFDQSYADPSRTKDIVKLCTFMSTALELFEPRLSDVDVELTRYDQANQKAHFVVSANIKFENTVEPVSFPVAVDHLEELGKPQKSK